MKKILCFGDSNTFGFNPANGLRFGKDERWTGVLQKLAAPQFEIVEAGCNNRTCFRDNFAGKKFTGYRILPEYLSEKYDLIVLTHILIIPPVPIGEEVLTSRIFSFLFDKSSVEKSHSVSEIYRETADKYNCYFLDLAGKVTPSKIDGLHFDAKEHSKIAAAVYNKIKEIIY